MVRNPYIYIFQWFQNVILFFLPTFVYYFYSFFISLQFSYLSVNLISISLPVCLSFFFLYLSVSPSFSRSLPACLSFSLCVLSPFFLFFFVYILYPLSGCLVFISLPFFLGISINDDLCQPHCITVLKKVSVRVGGSILNFNSFSQKISR